MVRRGLRIRHLDRRRSTKVRWKKLRGIEYRRVEVMLVRLEGNLRMFPAECRIIAFAGGLYLATKDAR